MSKWLWSLLMNGCKIFVFVFHVIVYFLAFWEAGLEMRPPHQRMVIRLSHIENKVVVYRKEVDATVGCGICLCCLVYHVLFVLLVGEFGKSPVAVALSLRLQFCVHILFFNNCTYVKVKRENTQTKIYIFCSLILFSLIVAWKIKVFGNI